MYLQMQKMWSRYVNAAYGCCSSKFWQVFACILEESTSCKDRVLGVVKKLLTKQDRSWPQSVRSLRSKINRQAGKFWDNVKETHVIDVTSFGIPACESVNFTFVDPIFLWAQRCAALSRNGIKLHWDAQALMTETGEEIYGSGVQYGTLMRSAISSVPQGGKVALISLSWDAGNTGFGSRSTKPLCLQVMNCNSASPVGVALLGYIPHLEAPDAFKDQKILALAQRHVIQEAVGFVLRAIEQASMFGFLVNIGGSDMLMFPRIGALPLDTPERVDYFGLRSMRSCDICRFRSGRSAARRGARHHDPTEIASLYDTGTCLARTYTYIYVHIHSYMLVCAHICSFAHIYAHLRTYVLMHTFSSIVVHV